MGLIVDKTALHRAIDQSAKAIAERDLRLRQTARACADLDGDGHLEGQAWQAAKQQADTLTQHISQTLAHDQAVLDDHRALAALLDHYIDDDYIAEDALAQTQDRLDALDQTIAQARDDLGRALPEAAADALRPGFDRLLDHDRQSSRWLQQKIERLHQFDQATANLYGGDKKGAEGDDKNWLRHHRWYDFPQQDNENDNKDEYGKRTDDEKTETTTSRQDSWETQPIRQRRRNPRISIRATSATAS